MTLSPRLEALYSLLLPDFPAWDVGYDHGKLGLYALASGKFPQVCFVDPVAELAANLQIKLDSRRFAPLKKNAIVYVCPLAELKTSVHGSIVFAGVGAHTILSNIESLMQESLMQESRFFARRAILSPHRDAEEFLEKCEEWAPQFSRKYIHLETKEVFERGRKRLIYIFEPVVSC